MKQQIIINNNTFRTSQFLIIEFQEFLVILLFNCQSIFVILCKKDAYVAHFLQHRSTTAVSKVFLLI